MTNPSMFRLLGICLACVGVGVGVGWTWRDFISPKDVPLNVKAGSIAAPASTARSDSNETERDAVAVPQVASPTIAPMAADRTEDARASGILSFDLSPTSESSAQRAAVVDLSSKLLADEQVGRGGVHDSAMSWNALDIYRSLGHPDKLLCLDGFVSWCYNGDDKNDGVAFTFYPSQVAAVGRWLGKQGQ